VGKTTRLLQAAQRLSAAGRDVAIAFVETHGRADVQSLVAGLATVERRRVTWRGVAIEDMDFPAVLARHPDVVVVDDVAHTNLPGSVNRRRYQDILAFLDAGIDVLAALDVQHLESLNDLVRRLGTLQVRETVPDSFFREADEWLVVDVPVDELQVRSTPGEAATETAGEAPFDPAHLTLLRELALREVADALDRRTGRTLRPQDDRAKTAAPVRAEAGRVMVGMSSLPTRAAALLRRGSRLAGRLNTAWFVVYVETPETRPSRLDAESTRQLFANIEMARELGGEVVRLESTEPAAALLDFARSHGVTHILIGRSRAPWWRQILGQSVALQLVREGADLDILIAALEQEDSA